MHLTHLTCTLCGQQHDGRGAGAGGAGADAVHLHKQLALDAPAGLVLYWLTSNLMTIGQQYVTNQLIGAKR